MRVTVRWFAALREARGREEEVVELPDGLSIGEAWRQLSPLPGLPVGLVVNREVARADQPVADGDEIAFLPPLGGG